jgi:NAD(P)-dependent dehydrogenase (short-subunit alcohol dehydrogenase family)
MKEFRGKVAVITGAGRGIGRGIALRCAKEGMRIVLAGIGLESLTKTCSDLESMGAETMIVQTDVSKVVDVENLAEKTVEHFGEIHLLVNNAGVAHVGSVWGSSLDDWEWVIGVNLWGVVYGVRTFIPIMMKQESECHIVNVSSMSGVLPGKPDLSSYSVSKHGVVALSESLYYELGKFAPHIKVSVYIPGWVNTEFYGCERNRPDRFKGNATSSPLTDEQEEATKSLFEAGLPIEEAADLVFEGIRADILYIGFRGFDSLHDGWFMKTTRQRAENMIGEINPVLPS